MTFEEAKVVLRAFERERVDYVLVGSMAGRARPGASDERHGPPPHGEYSLDILARLGEAFRYEDLDWEEVTVDGIRIRVATPRMLYLMKKILRPLDRADAARIREVFGINED